MALFISIHFIIVHFVNLIFISTFYLFFIWIIYNSKNIPKVEVAFKDIFPTSLSGLAYAQDATDVEYFKADATFRFMYYEFKNAT